MNKSFPHSTSCLVCGPMGCVSFTVFSFSFLHTPPFKIGRALLSLSSFPPFWRGQNQSPPPGIGAKGRSTFIFLFCIPAVPLIVLFPLGLFFLKQELVSAGNMLFLLPFSPFSFPFWCLNCWPVAFYDSGSAVVPPFLGFPRNPLAGHGCSSVKRSIFFYPPPFLGYPRR